MTADMGNVSISRRGSGPRPEFLTSPHLDNMLSMIMTLCQELWVVDERVLNLEKQLAELKGVDVDTLLEDDSTPDSRVARRAELDEFLRRVLRSTAESIEHPSSTQSYQDVVRKMSTL